MNGLCDGKYVVIHFFHKILICMHFFFCYKKNKYIKAVPPGFSGNFFLRFLRPKMTDFAAAFLNICEISCCFAVKIYHGQHYSNVVITFLTSRTIVGLQINI